MQGQKSHIKPHGGGWFNRELKIFILFLGLISFSNLIFSNNTFALFTPTLSASVDQTNLQINGNQVINSTNKTTEIPLNLTVNTNNKTGYTATLNSETDETALVNNDSSNGAKINSISTNLSLSNLPNNTWGYKFGMSSNYAPIPALSTPAQIIQTVGKTNGDESNQLNIGMKLTNNLEPGNYTNKLILSFVSNPYTPIAIMTYGSSFSGKLLFIETSTNKIEHFKKSNVAPAISMNAVNVEDEESDYEIKLWLDPTNKTAYYYTEPEKVYLNMNSSMMFSSMFRLTFLDLSNFDTSKVTNMATMFYGMRNLTTLDLSNFDTSKVTDMGRMFWGMDKLTTLNLSNFDTSQVTNMYGMFYGMRNLTTLDLSNFDTSKVTNMATMFYGMRNLTTLDLSNFDTSKVTDMGRMFWGMDKLTTLNLSNFDTSKVTNMGQMFSGIDKLTTLNLSNFDTSQVTNMYGMFDGMHSLTTLNLSNFDTSKVTDMQNMFYGISNLTSLNLSNFNTSQVTNMRVMFSGMSNLTTIDLSNFDTSQVTDMSYMFKGMSSLATLDLSNFNTSKVTDMRAMFSGMSRLTVLDLSNFDTSKVTSMDFMFALYDEDISKDKLERIYVNNDFNTTKLTDFSRMFKNRKKLRGGNGSYLTNPSTADKSWLRIDRPGVQGYFTRKS